MKVSSHASRLARQAAAYLLSILLTLATSAALYPFRESISLAVVAMVYLVPVTIGAVW